MEHLCVTQQFKLEDWKESTPLSTARKDFSLCGINNALYALGGYTLTGETLLSIVEKFEADVEKWVEVRSMLVARANLSSCVVENKIFVAGGGDNSIEVYDPRVDEWTPLVGAPDFPFAVKLCALQHYVYVIANNFFLRFDSLTSEWKHLSPLTKNVQDFFALNSMLYVCMENGVTECYDPSLEAWIGQLGGRAQSVVCVGNFAYTTRQCESNSITGQTTIESRVIRCRVAPSYGVLFTDSFVIPNSSSASVLHAVSAVRVAHQAMTNALSALEKVGGEANAASLRRASVSSNASAASLLGFNLPSLPLSISTGTEDTTKTITTQSSDITTTATKAASTSNFPKVSVTSAEMDVESSKNGNSDEIAMLFISTAAPPTASSAPSLPVLGPPITPKSPPPPPLPSPSAASVSLPSLPPPTPTATSGIPLPSRLPPPRVMTSKVKGGVPSGRSIPPPPSLPSPLPSPNVAAATPTAVAAASNRAKSAATTTTPMSTTSSTTDTFAAAATAVTTTANTTTSNTATSNTTASTVASTTTVPNGSASSITSNTGIIAPTTSLLSSIPSTPSSTSSHLSGAATSNTPLTPATPSSATSTGFQALVQQCLQQEQIEQAEELVGVMDRMGVKVSTSTLKSLLDIYLKREQLDKAESMLNRLESAGQRYNVNDETLPPEITASPPSTKLSPSSSPATTANTTTTPRVFSPSVTIHASKDSSNSALVEQTDLETVNRAKTVTEPKESVPIGDTKELSSSASTKTEPNSATASSTSTSTSVESGTHSSNNDQIPVSNSSFLDETASSTTNEEDLLAVNTVSDDKATSSSDDKKLPITEVPPFTDLPFVSSGLAEVDNENINPFTDPLLGFINPFSDPSIPVFTPSISDTINPFTGLPFESDKEAGKLDGQDNSAFSTVLPVTAKEEGFNFAELFESENASVKSETPAAKIAEETAAKASVKDYPKSVTKPAKAKEESKKSPAKVTKLDSKSTAKPEEKAVTAKRKPVGRVEDAKAKSTLPAKKTTNETSSVPPIESAYPKEDQIPEAQLKRAFKEIGGDEATSSIDADTFLAVLQRTGTQLNSRRGQTTLADAEEFLCMVCPDGKFESFCEAVRSMGVVKKLVIRLIEAVDAPSQEAKTDADTVSAAPLNEQQQAISQTPVLQALLAPVASDAKSMRAPQVDPSQLAFTELPEPALADLFAALGAGTDGFIDLNVFQSVIDSVTGFAITPGKPNTPEDVATFLVSLSKRADGKVDFPSFCTGVRTVPALCRLIGAFSDLDLSDSDSEK